MFNATHTNGAHDWAALFEGAISINLFVELSRTQLVLLLGVGTPVAVILLNALRQMVRSASSIYLPSRANFCLAAIDPSKNLRSASRIPLDSFRWVCYRVWNESRPLLHEEQRKGAVRNVEQLSDCDGLELNDTFAT